MAERLRDAKLQVPVGETLKGRILQAAAAERRPPAEWMRLLAQDYLDGRLQRAEAIADE